MAYNLWLQIHVSIGRRHTSPAHWPLGRPHVRLRGSAARLTLLVGEIIAGLRQNATVPMKIMHSKAREIVVKLEIRATINLSFRIDRKRSGYTDVIDVRPTIADVKWQVRLDLTG